MVRRVHSEEEHALIVVHHEDTLFQDLGGGNTRRILAWNDDLMLVEVGFDSGTVGAVHSHVHTQSSLVLSGRFKYTIEDETVEIGPGDSVIVPPGKLHGTLCIEAGKLLDVFTPARQDFITRT